MSTAVPAALGSAKGMLWTWKCPIILRESCSFATVALNWAAVTFPALQLCFSILLLGALCPACGKMFLKQPLAKSTILHLQKQSFYLCRTHFIQTQLKPNKIEQNLPGFSLMNHQFTTSDVKISEEQWIKGWSLLEQCKDELRCFFHKDKIISVNDVCGCGQRLFKEDPYKKQSGGISVGIFSINAVRELE